MSMSITAHRRVMFLFRVATERNEGVAASEMCDGGNNSCPFLSLTKAKSRVHISISLHCPTNHSCSHSHPLQPTATMAPLTHLLAASLALLTASASSVKDLTPSNFDEIVLHSGKPALVEFFAPWCGHCKTLAPIYDELASHFASVADKVTIAKVDADAEKDLGRRFGVQGFPTLKWFDGSSEEPEDYRSGRDLESLTKFVEEKTGVKAKAKRVERTAVDMLNNKTFKEQIGGDVDALVAFTAPWCGRTYLSSLRSPL